MGKSVQPIQNDVKDFDKLSTEELEKIAAGGGRESVPASEASGGVDSGYVGQKLAENLAKPLPGTQYE
jgi:hypothetical protein